MENLRNFDFIGNAILYGYITFKCDAFYVYCGKTVDGIAYFVAVDIDKVPIGHRNVPCQEPTEKDQIENMNELIQSQMISHDPTSLLHVDNPQDDNRELGEEVLEDVASVGLGIPCQATEAEADTDNDLWSGKRSLKQKDIDNHATALLLEIIKERWEVVAEKKLARRMVFTSIAEEMRARGVKISRQPDIAWNKVYNRWNKVKEKYQKYKDSTGETGKGSSAKPTFYDEVHELMGSRAIIKPIALSSSMPSGKRAAESMTSVDYDKERELIRKENAHLVEQGVMTQEEAHEAEKLVGGPSAPAKKKAKLGATAQIMNTVAASLDELKSLEEKRMEHFEKREKERDARAAKRDAFIKETEEQKIAVGNAMVQVLTGILKDKRDRSKRKRRNSSSSSSSGL